MPKKRKYTIATVLFLGIIVFSVIGAFPLFIDQTIVWMIVGICGALVAIENIKRNEENSFLIGTTGLLVIVIAMLTIPHFSSVLSNELMRFLVNLAFAFGIAGFVVALGLITRLGLEK